MFRLDLKKKNNKKQLATIFGSIPFGVQNVNEICYQEGNLKLI